jgi:hypothetical protein
MAFNGNLVPPENKTVAPLSPPAKYHLPRVRPVYLVRAMASKRDPIDASGDERRTARR